MHSRDSLQRKSSINVKRFPFGNILSKFPKPLRFALTNNIIIIHYSTLLSFFFSSICQADINRSGAKEKDNRDYNVPPGSDYSVQVKR
jgi:hypothetical protein